MTAEKKHIALLGVVAALGLFLGSSNPFLHVPLLIVAYPACLYAIALISPSPFRHGWAAGTLGAAASLYWIAIAVHDYGYLPWIIGGACALLLGAYVGLWAALFSTVMARLRCLPPVRLCLAAAVLWYILEWARSWFLSGFPWLTLASAQAPWPLLVQGASVVGEYGLSGLLAAIGIVLAQASGLAPVRQTGKKSCLTVATLILVGLLVFGAYRLQEIPPKEPSSQLALIQGNIRQDLKWDTAFQQDTVNTYLSLSDMALKAQPRILIWPETAMPFFFQPDHPLGQQITEFAQTTGTAIIFGAPGFGPSNDAQPTAYNRSYFIGDNGMVWGYYDKQHLVPFGEYIPPGFNLPIFASLMQGVGGFTPGTAVEPFALPEKDGMPPLSLGMLICYEAIFPEIAQQRVTQGAQVLVNISNDAWYNASAALPQHLSLSAMRAVEQKRWLARSTNTGLTAFVDPWGRLSPPGEIPAIMEPAVLVQPVYAVNQITLFHHLYAWLPALAMILLIVIVWPLARQKNGHCPIE